MVGYVEQDAETSAGVVEDAARRVEELLGRARTSVATGPARVSAALEAVHEPALRAAVASGLAQALLVALTASWQRGWQPADLERAARRKGRDALVPTLVGGIRAELATYSRSTVDPRWWRQVEDLGRGTRPSGRGGGDGGGDPGSRWRRRCVALLEATVLVERLPRLSILGAVPGAREHGAGDTAPVDDKLLTTVRRLLAQAEGTPYEAEAETFTAAAQSLMARHRIDRAMLDSSDPQRQDRRPDAIRLSVDRPYDGPKMQLLHQICVANRCTAVWTQAAGFATVVGFQADRRAVELLYTSLLVQATAAMRREGEQRGQAGRSRGFRSSFLLGFATRVGQRLEEASRAEESRAGARLPGGGPDDDHPAVTAGADDVALVLSRRDGDVRARTRELFPSVRTGRVRQVSDDGGFLQGRAAADRADLGVGAQLTGRAS